MPIDFIRLSGAAGDVKEIEYVSALMQTDEIEMRTDGSVLAEDIQLFLRSRYGVDVSESIVKERIFGSLAGNGKEKQCVDLMDTLTLLFIPTILKASITRDSNKCNLSDNNLFQPKKGLLQFVLSMILHDTTGNHTPKRLNKRLLQRILASYGEADLALDDGLLEEMLLAASSSDGKTEGLLNLEAFTLALTNDIQLYDVECESRLTTNYDDVFLPRNHRDHSDWHTEEETTEDIESTSNSKQNHYSSHLAQQRKSISHSLPQRYTAPHIDMIVGTYRSKSLIVLLWATFAINFYGFYSGTFANDGGCDGEPYAYGGSWSDNRDAVGCTTVYSIFRWLFLFIYFCFYGLFFIGLGSLGNDVNCRHWYVPMVGAVLTVFSVLVVPYFVLPRVDEEVNERRFTIMGIVSLCLGAVVVFLHLCHSVSLLVPQRWLRHFPRVHLFLEKQNILGEVHTKKAAASKMNNLLRNALELTVPRSNDRGDGVTETHFGSALEAYTKHGKQFESVGGFLWTWKRVWTGSIFYEEGIWLSARLVASNVAQFVVVIFVLFAGFALTRQLVDTYNAETAKQHTRKYIDYVFDNEIDVDLLDGLIGNISQVFSNFLSNSSVIREEVCSMTNVSTASVESACQLVDRYYECGPSAMDDYLCILTNYRSGGTAVANATETGLLQFGLLNASGLDAEVLIETVRGALQTAAQQTVDSLYPVEEYMVRIPSVVGSLVAFVTALSLAVTYLPSTITTTLKLRCGMIPSLKDPNFARYRTAVDTVTLLTGSLFWGCLVASIMVGGIVGLIVFFFVWQATTHLVQNVIAIVIGIVTVVLIKYLIVQCCRFPTYKSFYRKRPAAANIWNLALECANFALSVGFISARLVKLTLVAVLYVGRIDVPFLAEGVGEVIGCWELDNYPSIFLRDVLAHEAHRHPYVELLGVLYLMHLRYDKNFGSRAGATWRLIFVCALMPWMNKYRILPSPSDDDRDDSSAPSTKKGNEDDANPLSEIDFVSLRNTYEDADNSQAFCSPDDMQSSRSLTQGGEMPCAASNTAAVQRSETHPEDHPPQTQRASLIDRAGHKRMSGRDSLLAQELGMERIYELEEEKQSLADQLVALKKAMMRLQEQISRRPEETEAAIPQEITEEPAAAQSNDGTFAS